MCSNWCKQAQDHSTWHEWINAAAEDVNEEMEAAEQRKKDELKQRKKRGSQEQAQSGWKCTEQGCHFAGWNKAGLVNHIRQRHSREAQKTRRAT